MQIFPRQISGSGLRRRLAGLLLSTTILVATGHCRADSPPPWRIVAGALPPFSVETGEGASGALVEIAELLTAHSKDAIKVEFFPWQRAVLMARTLPRVAVLPLTRTPEREAQYHWLVKLYHQDFVFVARHSGGHDLRVLDDLKTKRIAVLRGSPHLAYLREHGYAQVFEASSTEEMHRMLERGIADLLYGGAAINKATIRRTGARLADFRFSAPLASGDIWLAGSPDMTDADGAFLQASMKTLVANGSYARILRKYGLGD